MVIGQKISDELRQKMQEGRKQAIPKKTYGDAIQAQCEQCSGNNPAVTDCEHTACVLYVVNTREKRRQRTKTSLKKLIRPECYECCGPIACGSHVCPLRDLNPWNQKATRRING